MKKLFIKVLFVLLVGLLVLPTIKSLLPLGFFQSHDGAFHLIRLWQFDKAVSSGVFPVRWAADLNHGLGSPLFNFFYPLPYYLGETFHLLGFSFASSLKLVAGFGLILSWIFTYLWLKTLLTNRWAAFTGASFYLYAPYRFLTTYVAFMFGEMVALMIIPLVLYSWEGFFKTKKRSIFILACLVTAALVLSHNILALIFLPIISFYLLIRNWGSNNLKWLGLGLIVALGISAYFWLPALGEKQYVSLGQQPAAVYQDHFPSLKQLLYSAWGYGYSAGGINDGMSFQAGLATWLVIGLSLIFFAWSLIKNRKVNRVAGFYIFLYLLVIFLMLQPSLFIWKTFSFLANIQYPWRLLSVLVLSSSFLSGWLIVKTNSKVLAIILIVLVLIANRNHLKTVDSDRHPDSFYLDKTSFASADISQESLPVWVKGKPKPYQKKLMVNQSSKLVNQSLNYQDYNFELELDKPGQLTINTFYFPGWQVTIDGQETKLKNTSGLINFSAPAGHHLIKASFKNTPIRKVANFISIFSLGFLAMVVLKLNQEK